MILAVSRLVLTKGLCVAHGGMLRIWHGSGGCGTIKRLYVLHMVENRCIKQLAIETTTVTGLCTNAWGNRSVKCINGYKIRRKGAKELLRTHGGILYGGG
jgi:hypothetical protein